MSRRRPARGKHLERDQVVADQVVVRPRCPGRCNTAARRREAEFARDVERSFERRARARRSELGRALSEGELERLLHDAKVAVGETWSRAGRVMLVFRLGDPVWCPRCAGDVRDALEALPRLLLWTLETGIVQARRPAAALDGSHGADGALVAAPVAVLDAGPGGDAWHVTEDLACGHRHTRGQGPEHPDQTRVCLTCVASAIVPEPGRLAPAERAARRGGRRRTASPAGSPAWVEVDAAIRWACELGDELAFVLDGPLLVDGVTVRRWPRAHGTLTARVGSAAAAVRYVAARLDRVQQLGDVEVVDVVRRAALGVQDRLERVCGMKVLVHSLTDPCPSCHRRGLRRVDGGSMVSCVACYQVWAEADFERLAQNATLEVAR